MQGIEESESTFRFRVADPDHFERLHVKPIADGVKVTVGKVKGTERWEIQSYLFDKPQFQAREQVRMWLDGHLKGEIATLLDFRAWNEYRRRAVNAYMQISRVQDPAHSDR